MAQHNQPSKNRRETNLNALKVAMWRLLDKKTLSSGDVVYPCVPALADSYANRLSSAWSALGRAFSPAEIAGLSSLLARAMTEGRALSPFASLRVHYEATPPPRATLQYKIEIIGRPPEAEPQPLASQENEEPIVSNDVFGQRADAKVIAAAQMNAAPAPKAIDVGAGTGRNALELARRGFTVDAVEAVSELATEIRRAADAEQLPVNVIGADFFEADMPSIDYRLAILSEVATQLDADQVKLAFQKLSGALDSGGLLLVNLFLTTDGFRPDAAMRELSLSALCRVYTRAELQALVEGLPLKLLSDESAFQFERAHLPADAWPPTPWFESWALGSNLFDVPHGMAPFELRWLLFQRL